MVRKCYDKDFKKQLVKTYPHDMFQGTCRNFNTLTTILLGLLNI